MTREFTGRDMALLMIAFFAVVVSVNMTMAVIASGSWTGLVVKNSYVASQQFNEKTAELERSAAMNVHASLAYQKGEVVVQLNDSSGAVLSANAVTLRLGRPSYDGEDRSLTMTCSAEGTCRARAELGSGIWNGEVEAQLPGLGHWSRAVRLIVREG